MRVPEIYRLTNGALQQADEPLYDIIHITEATCLLPVSVDGEGYGLECLGDKIRNDAPVILLHPWTVTIEDSGDGGVNPQSSAIGRGHGFPEPLSLVIYASRPEVVDVAGVLFRLRVDLRISIDLRRRSKQVAGVFGMGELECGLRPHGSGPKSLDGVPSVVHGACR